VNNMPMNRGQIERAVKDLFVNGAGHVATRLVLVDEQYGKPGMELGGWCQMAVVDRLCESLNIK
jgi:hypothetical protein